MHLPRDIERKTVSPPPSLDITVEPLQLLKKQIQSALSPDLLTPQWRKIAEDKNNPMCGHCYAATEAAFWSLGGPKSDWTPQVVGNKQWSGSLQPGETHWFLKNSETGEILDVTAGQFDTPVPYETGVSNGMMCHPKGGSRRARVILSRLRKNGVSYEADSAP